MSTGMLNLEELNLRLRKLNLLATKIFINMLIKKIPLFRMMMILQSMTSGVWVVLYFSSLQDKIHSE